MDVWSPAIKIFVGFHTIYYTPIASLSAGALLSVNENSSGAHFIPIITLSVIQTPLLLRYYYYYSTSEFNVETAVCLHNIIISDNI